MVAAPYDVASCHSVYSGSGTVQYCGRHFCSDDQYNRIRPYKLYKSRKKQAAPEGCLLFSAFMSLVPVPAAGRLSVDGLA